MPHDPRPRFRLLQPIEAKTDRAFFWLRVGTAYQNPDGTIDAYFDRVVLGVRFRLRLMRPGERGDAEPHSEDAVPELLS